MNLTSIGWTDYSANPLKYSDAAGKTRWACAKVSAGCTNCYSEALAKRWGRGSDYNLSEVKQLTPYLDAKELAAIRTYKPASGKRCFVGDMTDIFGEWVPVDLIDSLVDAFKDRPDVVFQVLTKRPEIMRTLAVPFGFPRNMWCGTSVEDRAHLHRLDDLRAVTVPIRFVSFEPLLQDLGDVDLTGIQWAIVGGESGPRYRACELSAITNLVDHCRAQNVPVFVKQDAHRLPGKQGRIPDSHFVQEFPL